MKKLIQRLLVFFIGLPLLAAVVFLLPHWNFLALNILVIVFSSLGAAELAAMFDKKELHISKPEAFVLGAFIPFLVTLTTFFKADLIIPAGIVLALCWILFAPVFSGYAVSGLYINRIAAGFAVLIYPGFFLAWISRLAFVWGRNVILVFLLIPIACDSMAWAIGMLFGKGNRGIIKISPNKSIAGFIGGLSASALVGFAAVLLVPEFRPVTAGVIVKGILLGLGTGIAATLGDLCESAIKRSAGCKDSGNLIPGRGGVLDSVDAMAMSAPVFCIILSIILR